MVFLPDNMPWYEWLCHSNFSFLTGSSFPQEYVERAQDLAYQSIGVCDYDGVYGLAKAFGAHHKIIETGVNDTVKLTYGIEFHLRHDHDLPTILQDTIILKAQSFEGYRKICSFSSLCHRDGKKNPVLSIDDLTKIDPSGIICMQPMRGMIRFAPTDQVIQRYKDLKDHFQDNFVLVISRHLHPIEDQWINKTLEIASRLAIKFVFSQDAYFHHSDRKKLNDVMHAIRLNKVVDQCQSHLFLNQERCLREKHILHQRYSKIPGFDQAMRYSSDLVESFDFSLSQIRYKYPKEMIPDGFSAHSFLEFLVWDSLYTNYPNPPSKLINVINNELKLIDTLEFADYFLTVWDIVRWARSKDILCQGRGSAANSAVCFMLGITAVDPSLFDLLFERFISLERGDPPDIDVDFEHERREEVIQYIYRRYGRRRAAMVANIISFRGRSAIRSVGKALGVDEKLIVKASDLQKTRFYRRNEAVDTINAVKQDEDSIKEKNIPWDLWSDLAGQIRDFPRHLGIHSGGFVISHYDLDMICGCEPASMEDRTVVQWDKTDIEDLGLFKIDILALGMLTTIRKTFDMISLYQGKRLRLSTIPHDDVPTYQMIQRADTVGVFQIESRAQMSMLPRLRPKEFYDLVVQVGIIRPGPIQGGLVHPYLRRRHGLEPVFYPHDSLEPILKRTLGVPIFQEQVMRIAMSVGDFTAGEADKLRKHIGSWSMNKNMLDIIEKLESGMRRHHISETHIRQLVGYLQGFSEYGFPESHAASFALLAYASSYLKCHFSEAFYASLINSQPMGFYSVHAIIQQARRDGIEVLPISINHSQVDCTLEKRSISCDADSLSIRLGFRLVHGLSQVGAKSIVDQRERSGRWENLSDFLKDHPLNKGDLTSIAASNALSELGSSRLSAIWLAEAAPYASLVEDDQYYKFSQKSELENIQADFKSFGTSLGAHPVSITKRDSWHYNTPVRNIKTSRELKHLTPNQLISVFGMALVRQAPSSAKGMVFLTLEDESGFINLALTPFIYDRYRHIIDSHGFLCVQGKLQSIEHSHSILVKKVFEPMMKLANVVDLNAIQEVRGLKEQVVIASGITKSRNYM